MRYRRAPSAQPVASPRPLASLSLRSHAPPGDEDPVARFQPYRPEGVARVDPVAQEGEPCERSLDPSVWIGLGSIVR